MAGQAGWYRAPGEEGLLRYWNGATWTEHRQPDPAATAPPPPRVPDIETDPMAEYERQFDSSSSMFDLPRLEPSFNFDQRSFDSPSTDAPLTLESAPAPAPISEPALRPQAALSAPAAPAPAHEFAGASTSAPRSFAPRPAPMEFTPLGPIPLGLATLKPIVLPADFESTTEVATGPSEVVQEPKEPETIVVAARPVVTREPLAIEAAASAPAVVAPDRRKVVGAARGMVIAALVIVIGIGAIAFFSVQTLAGPGEVKTTGIVTSLGSTTGNSCTPIARFAVQGRSLTAGAKTAMTPCSVGLGQSVAIFYSAANPASGARIELGSSVTAYLWVVPVLGFLFLLASLTTFIVRAGSIASGIRLLRAGRGESKRPLETA